MLYAATLLLIISLVWRYICVREGGHQQSSEQVDMEVLLEILMDIGTAGDAGQDYRLCYSSIISR